MRGTSVLVRPLGTVPHDVLARIKSDLSTDLDCLVTLGPAMPLPMHGYVRQRRQYLSGVILKQLTRSGDGYPGHKILGVTCRDLFTPGRTFLFGHAIVSGNAAVISTSRLCTPRSSTPSRASKEAIHEIGHTLGLRHCGNLRCVMTFSESVEAADTKTHSLCDFCSSKLGPGFADGNTWEPG